MLLSGPRKAAITMIDKPQIVLMPKKIGLMSAASIVTEQVTTQEIVALAVEIGTGTRDPDQGRGPDPGRRAVDTEIIAGRNRGIVVIARTEGHQPDTVGTVAIDVIGSTEADRVPLCTNVIETKETILRAVSELIINSVRSPRRKKKREEWRPRAAVEQIRKAI